MILGNQARIVTLDGVDITDYVLDLPFTPAIKPKWGEIPDPATLAIQVRADDFFFVPTHPVSILFNRNFEEMAIVVTTFGSVSWSGYLLDVKPDLQAKRLTLIGDSILGQKIRSNGRIDTTTTNPADAAEKMLRLYDIPVDSASFSVAQGILDDIPVSIRVSPNSLEWAGSIADLLRLLALSSVGRFYLTKEGEIGFDAWALPDDPLALFTITDDILLQWPSMEDESFEPLDGYSVTFQFGTTKTGSGNIKTLDFGANSAVIMTTQQGADYCGSQWVELSKIRYYRVICQLDKAYSLVAIMGDYVEFDSEKIGLSGVFGEIVGIDDGDSRWVSLTLLIDKAQINHA